MLCAVTTPYDAERGRYSRAALARLVLSDETHGLSEAAGNLMVTRYDAYCGPGGRVSEAVALGEGVEQVLTSAVIYERERGSSWDAIGRCLGVSGMAAQERFGPAIDSWQAAFEVPYRLDPTGRKRIPQLPTAAYDPASACRILDLSARVRFSLFDDDHAVSGGLDGAEPEPSPDCVAGEIERRHVTALLRVASRYANHEPEGGDWNAVEEALDAEGRAVYVLEGVYRPCPIRMTSTGGGDRVAVEADTGVGILRLRIGTLLDAFA